MHVFGPWLAFGAGLGILGGLQVGLGKGDWSGFLVTLPLGLAVGVGGALYRSREMQRRSGD